MEKIVYKTFYYSWIFEVKSVKYGKVDLFSSANNIVKIQDGKVIQADTTQLRQIIVCTVHSATDLQMCLVCEFASANTNI